MQHPQAYGVAGSRSVTFGSLPDFVWVASAGASVKDFGGGSGFFTEPTALLRALLPVPVLPPLLLFLLPPPPELPLQAASVADPAASAEL